MTDRGTIVFVSNTHWHSAWQTANSVAAGFAARGYRVLYVEPLPKRWPRLTEAKRVVARLAGRSRLAGEVRQAVPTGLTLIAPLALPDVGRIPQYMNRLYFVPRLASRLRKIAPRPLIMIHSLPIHAAIALQQRLRPDVSIYRCVYDWARDPYSRRRLAEPELLSQVDVAWADCGNNLARVHAVQPRATLMPPAVDSVLFETTTYGRSGNRQPLCVYFGTLGLSIDLDLLRRISHRFTLRLVGPVRCSLDGFAPTTEIMGVVPHEQVPMAIHDADVLLLPYNTRPHMQGVIPAKLFECLITGKPTVATNLTSVDQYADLLYLCDGVDAALAAIEASQSEDRALAARRIACARENDWSRRLQQMEGEIQTLLAERRRDVVVH